jgi:transposase-like protein
MQPRRLHHAPITRSTFARFYFPPDVIVLTVRWYLRFNLSYRNLEELLAERGIEVDHTSVYRGSNASSRCWPTPLGRAGVLSGAAGRSTRPT